MDLSDSNHSNDQHYNTGVDHDFNDTTPTTMSTSTSPAAKRPRYDELPGVTQPCMSFSF